MKNLMFRRQFLFTAKKCAQLEDWHMEILDSDYLYVHKDCDISRIDKYDISFLLIGYTINPKCPHKTTNDILSDISDLASVNDISEYLYSMAGRYVLIIKSQSNLIFFNDACGLKTVYYTKYNGDIYAASQPLLMELVIPLNRGGSYQQYHNSTYVRRNKEHWLPSGSALYDDVYHLVPNHYYDSSVNKQIRYYPYSVIRYRKPEEAIEEFSSLLRDTMIAANNRFKLALSITAGLDSRTIMSACKPIATDIYYYTLQYRNLTKKSDDIKTPAKLLQGLDLKHQVIDCRQPIDVKFEKIYQNNTDLSHLDDWGIIASSMYHSYPMERVAVKGNCAEIGRCFYYPGGKHEEISSYEAFVELEDGWDKIPFIKTIISDWYERIKDNKVSFGYDLLDLFYWEHRVGSWQAQSQLEWDIVQETFTPFNNRELLDIILSVPSHYRCSPNYIFFKKSIRVLWKDVLKVPINTIGPKVFIKDMVISLLDRTGIINIIKTIRKY